MKFRVGWEHTKPVIHGHELSLLERWDEHLHGLGYSVTEELHFVAPLARFTRVWRRCKRLIKATFGPLLPP